MKKTAAFLLKISVVSTIVFLIGNSATAQPGQPAPPQSQSILITGATAHLGNGKTIQNAAIGFENGKLTLIADATHIRLDLSKYKRVVDASGKHVWPGLVALDTRLGLVEVEAARATRDDDETGELNPNARAIIAYNADSEVPPTVRSNGVLTAQICPGGGRISGQSSVVQLDAWNWEDAALKIDEGIHLNWPVKNLREDEGERRFPRERKEDDFDNQLRALDQLFAEAKAWLGKPAPEAKNQRFEAMRGLFDRSKTLYLHAELAKSIEESVLFAEKWGCRPVVVGGGESWLVADFLKKHAVAVVLSRTHAVPRHDDSDIDQNFKTPALLAAAGVEFAISNGGSWQVRNLAFQAGQAVGFGLDKEAALTAVTLEPAKILGIADRLGSLETGKDATLFVTPGDALDMRTCKVEMAFIGGREISLDNRQTRLYRKFSKKN